MNEEVELIHTDSNASRLALDSDIRDQATPTETNEITNHDYVGAAPTPVDASIQCTYTMCESSHYQPLHPMMFYDNHAHHQHQNQQHHPFVGPTQHYWGPEQYLQVSPMTMPVSHESSQYIHKQHCADGQGYPISVALPAGAMEEGRMIYDRNVGLNNSQGAIEQNVNASKITEIMSDIENTNDPGERRILKRRRRRRRKRTAATSFEHWSPSSWQDSSGSSTSISRALHNEIERRRRHRIKECCDALKELVPGLSDKTDKATVLEQTVRFVKHSFDCPNKCNCEFVVQESQQ